MTMVITQVLDMEVMIMVKVVTILSKVKAAVV